MIQAGDGSWQRMLDQGRCPKCRSLMTKLVNEQMMVKRECLVCNLTINEMDRDNEKGEYFKVLAWTNKLKMFSPNDHYEILNSGLNMYFE